MRNLIDFSQLAHLREKSMQTKSMETIETQSSSITKYVFSVQNQQNSLLPLHLYSKPSFFHWKPEFDKNSEEASFTELSREIIRNTPSELIRNTLSRQETMDSDCIHLSRPCTAASTIVDPVEMQEIENAFMLHDDEY